MSNFNNLLNSFHTNLKLVKKLEGGAAMKNEKGFTLIELLIVVSIILILVSIGIPMLSKSPRIAAERAAISKEIQNCFAAFQMGKLENSRCEILHNVNEQVIKFEPTTIGGNECWKVVNLTYTPHDNRIRYRNDKFEANLYCSNVQTWIDVKYRGDWR